MANNYNCCKTHCCKLHGCKYMFKNCPVKTGKTKQAYRCEDCYEYQQKAKHLKDKEYVFFDDKLKQHKITVASIKDEIIED